MRRIVGDYVKYHHDDRLHDSLAKDAPNRRVVEQRPGVNAKVLSTARPGGLNHRYTRDQAVRIHFNCRVSVAYVAAKVGPWGDRCVLEGQDLSGGRRGLMCVFGT
jgi:hypothetical protein